MINDWMVKIPAGEIQLRDDRKKTTWRTQLESFQLSKYQITQEIYFQVTGKAPASFLGNSRPIENVTWFDAIHFCNRLSQLSSLQPYYLVQDDTVSRVNHSNGYRLPTDAEWEYACRALTNKVQYGEVDQIAWYAQNSKQKTHDVGLKCPNDFGLYDMLGNVWEWCWDLYDPQVYGEYRVFRGGGWADETRSCLASNRRRSHPTYAIDDLGFRVARNDG